MMNRRDILAGAGAAMLAGCTTALPTSPRSRNAALPADLQPVRNAGFDAWLTAFRPRAQAKGVSVSTLNSGLAGAGFLPGVVTRDRNQTEFKRSLEDYLAIGRTRGKSHLRAAALWPVSWHVGRDRGTLRGSVLYYGRYLGRGKLFRNASWRHSGDFGNCNLGL